MESLWCKGNVTNEIDLLMPVKTSGVDEKLIVAQLVMKFSQFYGTRRFVTVFTTARYQSQS
jgi:hypothetical protein